MSTSELQYVGPYPGVGFKYGETNSKMDLIFTMAHQ